MNILMIGLGSIGQRHLRNIKRLYGEDVHVSAYRVRRNNMTFSDDMKIREGVNLEQEYNIRLIEDLDRELLVERPIVFVTNITAAHVEYALKASKAGCDIFLEKPVSDRLAGLDELTKIARKKGNIIYVGYQNRFHPCIADIQEILREQTLGNVVSVYSEFGERLATMHTYEDYRTTYMAKKNMGGGPMLNLQIHCLDYLQLLFGKPVSVSSYVGCSGLNGIDVEDHASSIYRFIGNDNAEIPIVACTDFYQYPPSHILKIVFEKGYVVADFNSAATTIHYSESSEVINHKEFARNDMFIAELKDFMECIKNRRTPNANLEQGMLGLKMVLAAKKSAARGGSNEKIR